MAALALLRLWAQGGMIERGLVGPGWVMGMAFICDMRAIAKGSK